MSDMRWDQTRFDDTLARYMEVTSRSVTQVVNTKAWYIARKAIWFTEKADRGKIESSLGRMVMVNRLTKSGKTVRRRQLELVQSERTQAPLAALIINSRLGKKNLPGLYGRAMDAAIRDLLSSRYRSIGFIKSGWLPSVQKLGPLADKGGAAPQIDTAARRFGLEKGYAEPAEPGWAPSAAIINEAVARHDAGGAALSRVGSKGLQMAFDDEAASMEDYIRRKLEPEAGEFNRAQH